MRYSDQLLGYFQLFLLQNAPPIICVSNTQPRMHRVRQRGLVQASLTPRGKSRVGLFTASKLKSIKFEINYSQGAIRPSARSAKCTLIDASRLPCT